MIYYPKRATDQRVYGLLQWHFECSQTSEMDNINCNFLQGLLFTFLFKALNSSFYPSCCISIDAILYLFFWFNVIDNALNCCTMRQHYSCIATLLSYLISRCSQLFSQINIISPRLVGNWQFFGEKYCDGHFILQPAKGGKVIRKFDTRYQLFVFHEYKFH